MIHPLCCTTLDRTMTERASLTIADGCATILLRRGESRNALDCDTIVALRRCIDAAAVECNGKRGVVRSLVLAGEGKSFCAGMDLKGVLHDAVRMGDMLRGLSSALLALRRLPVPTIARVQGAAIGGGCGLAVVCDFAITHPEAKLGYPEVDLGVCPAVVAPWLVRRIGAGPARAMLLAGGTMGGEEAAARGLVTRCVPAADLDAEVAALAGRLATGGAEALACTKRMLNELDGSLDEKIAADAAELSARVIAGPEAQASLTRLYALKPQGGPAANPAR